MQINHEYELKLMIKQAEYEKLLYLCCEESYYQTNYYFDTPDFALHHKKVVLRIRKKKDSYELTVKTKDSGASEFGVVSMEEKNIPLDCDTAESFIFGNADIGDHIGNEHIKISGPIVYVGEITTIRTNILINEGLPIAELDKSMYNCITDFELEWEISKNEYEKAVNSLKSIGILLDGRRSGLSKYGRLVDSIRKGK